MNEWMAGWMEVRFVGWLLISSLLMQRHTRQRFNYREPSFYPHIRLHKRTRSAAKSSSSDELIEVVESLCFWTAYGQLFLTRCGSMKLYVATYVHTYTTAVNEICKSPVTQQGSLVPGTWCVRTCKLISIFLNSISLSLVTTEHIFPKIITKNNFPVDNCMNSVFFFAD